MNSFTLSIKSDTDQRTSGDAQFFMCSKCHAAYHGTGLILTPCIKCHGGKLLVATPDPDPPPPSPRYMVCDKCGYIITGRRTRKGHKAGCDCITVHFLFKELH